MNTMKKRFVWVVVLAMVMSFVLSVPAYAEEEFTVHVQVPSDWGTPGLWAWKDPDLVNVFEAWPGQQLTADTNNQGWFYYSIPTWANCIIVNDNGVGKQTLNLPVDPKELWVTVTDSGVDVVYEAPKGFATGAEVTAGDSTAADAASDDASLVGATDEDTADTTPAVDVPKTGVVDLMYVYLGLAGLSGTGYVVIKRKKTA